jgi:hypothetical protein
VRALVTHQEEIRGGFGPHLESVQVGQEYQGTELVPIYRREAVENPVLGPMDSPASYGGRFVDAGIGIDARIVSGALRGSRFALEWLEPVDDDYHGYQLRRTGTLVFSWTLRPGR